MTKKRQFCPQGHDCFLLGRDRSGRCLECKRLTAEARDRAIATEEAAREAERQRRRDEFDRLRERKYRAAIRAGGDVALEARWWRLDSETYDAYGGRYSLCQWSTESGGLGGCFNRTTGDVYCAKHNRQLEREIERERRERERELRRR